MLFSITGFEEIPEVFAADNKISYNTFPRTSIRNVMEGKNLKFKPLDVNSFGHAEDRDASDKTSVSREMVPLVPASQNSPPDNRLKKHKKVPFKVWMLFIFKLFYCSVFAQS